MDLFFTVMLKAGMPLQDAQMLKATLPSLARSKADYDRWNRDYTPAEITPVLLVLESQHGEQLAREYAKKFFDGMRAHYQISDADVLRAFRGIGLN